MSVDITIIKRDGRREPLDITKIQKMTSEAVKCEDLERRKGG